MGLFSYQYVPYVVTVFVLLVLLSAFLLVRRSSLSKSRVTEDFVEQLNVMSQGFSGEVSRSGVPRNPFELWNDFWGSRVYDAGLVDKGKVSKTQIGQVVLLGSLLVYFLFFLVFRNVGIGLIPVLSFYLFFILWLEGEASKVQAVFDEQIPGFLSLLKSNIQAGQTPERALVDAIDETDKPLFDELKNARALIEVGSFQVALANLRESTSSDILKFLCSCIELSASVGANLEDQIENIEAMLESNRELKRKVKVAASKHIPLLFLSAVLIPGIFLFMYFVNQQIRDFWFVVPISWVAFFAVILIYGGGTFFTKRLIKNTTKL